MMMNARRQQGTMGSLAETKTRFTSFLFLHSMDFMYYFIRQYKTGNKKANAEQE